MPYKKKYIKKESNTTIQKDKKIKAYHKFITTSNLSNNVIGYYRSTNNLRKQDCEKYKTMIKKFCTINNKKLDNLYTDVYYNYDEKDKPFLFKLCNYNKNIKDLIIPSVTHISRTQEDIHYLAEKFNKQGRNVYFIKEDMTIKEMDENLYKTKTNNTTKDYKI